MKITMILLHRLKFQYCSFIMSNLWQKHVCISHLNWEQWININFVWKLERVHVKYAQCIWHKYCQEMKWYWRAQTVGRGLRDVAWCPAVTLFDWCCHANVVGHKRIIYRLFPFMLWTSGIPKCSSLISSFVAALHISRYFLLMGQQAGIRVCYKFSNIRNTHYFKLRGNDAVSRVCWNALKDSQRNVRALEMMQVVRSCQLLKIWKWTGWRRIGKRVNFT